MNNQFQGLCIDMNVPKPKTDIKNPKLLALFYDSLIWTTKNVNNNVSITFIKDPENAWSHIGTSANRMGKNILDPSMNFGYIDPPFEDFCIDGKYFKKELFINEKRNYCQHPSYTIEDCRQPNGTLNFKPGGTILHEFGHLLGQMHEHQNHLNPSGDPNKANPLVFNIPAMEKDLNLTKDFIENNIVQSYQCITNQNQCKGYYDSTIGACSNKCPYSGSDFDPKSIMLYTVPKKFLLQGPEITPNFEYSDTDKLWLSKKYPKNNNIILKIFFIDYNSPEWKKYWVKYVVKNYLEPIVGVKFYFYTRTHPTKLQFNLMKDLPNSCNNTNTNTNNNLNLNPIKNKMNSFKSNNIDTNTQDINIDYIYEGIINDTNIDKNNTTNENNDDDITNLLKNIQKDVQKDNNNNNNNTDTSISIPTPISIPTSISEINSYMPTDIDYTQLDNIIKTSPFYDEQSIEPIDVNFFYTNKTGINSNADIGYPRPQGNLNMLDWGLTSEAKNALESYYKNVGITMD